MTILNDFYEFRYGGHIETRASGGRSLPGSCSSDTCRGVGPKQYLGDGQVSTVHFIYDVGRVMTSRYHSLRLAWNKCSRMDGSGAFDNACPKFRGYHDSYSAQIFRSRGPGGKERTTATSDHSPTGSLLPWLILAPPLSHIVSLPLRPPCTLRPCREQIFHSAFLKRSGEPRRNLHTYAVVQVRDIT